MRLFVTDIGHSVELHKMFVEFTKDLKMKTPKPDMWLYKYANANFVCLMAKHGKKPIGFVYGTVHPYYDEPMFEVEGVFLRRAFRGKMRFVRKFVASAKKILKDEGFTKVVFTKPKQQKEREI
jgi:hypothetical protein